MELWNYKDQQNIQLTNKRAENEASKMAVAKFLTLLSVCFFASILSVQHGSSIYYTRHQKGSDFEHLLWAATTPASLIYKHFKHSYYQKDTPAKLNFVFFNLALILSGDVCINPGPCSGVGVEERNCSRNTSFPCLVCQRFVDWCDDAVQCDACDYWIHRACVNISTREYDRLAD